MSRVTRRCDAVPAAFAGLATQAVTVDAGQVENQTTAARRELQSEFGDERTVLQVVIGVDGDVRALAPLRTSRSI
jgi:hypothetical protein